MNLRDCAHVWSSSLQIKVSKWGAFAVLLSALSVLQVRPQQSEKVVVLEHADSLVGKILEGENVRELIGNVRFRQGTVIVDCDRAVQYLQSRKVSLAGNVIVRDDTMTLKSRRGMYHNADRIAEAFEEVRLDDGKTVLTADYGRYDVGEKKAMFRGNVKVQDSVSTLTSDELTYFREDKHSFADENVRIVSSENNLTIEGHHFENYTRRGFSRMTKQPKVLQIDTASDGTVDTFVVRSRVMESYRDPVRHLLAIDSVRMWSSELAAESGLGIYFMEDDSIILRKNPFIWYEENQVSGDSIFMKLQKRKPRTVFVRGDAFAISRSDSLHTKRFDQLAGELITMQFEGGKIRSIDVDRTATSIYHLYEQEKDSIGVRRRPNGMNKSTGDHVVISFVNGKAERISVVGGVEGEYFPENMVEGREDEYSLPGFNWREDRPGILRKARKPSAVVQSAKSLPRKSSRLSPKKRDQDDLSPELKKIDIR